MAYNRGERNKQMFKTIIDTIAIIMLLGGFAGCAPVVSYETTCHISSTVTRPDGSQYHVEEAC
jgi:hypothetical protein